MNLYLVRLTHPTTDESFYKVGVTSQSVKERFAYGNQTVKDSDRPFKEKIERMMAGEKYVRNNPYRETVLHQVEYTFDGDALTAERDLLSALKLGKQFRPKEWFSGVTECFLADADTLGLVKQAMDQDCDKKNADAPSELRYKMVQAFSAKNIADPIEKHLFVLAKCRGQGPGTT